MSIAFWVMLAGGILFAVCHEREKVPTFIARLVAFGVGLLAFLLK